MFFSVLLIASTLLPLTLTLAATDDDFTFENSEAGYTPSAYVEYGHKISGEEFSVEYSYFVSVAYAPIAVIGAAILCWLLFDGGLLFRCCFTACKCLPDYKAENFEHNRTVNAVFFYIFCIIALGFDQGFLYGNLYYDKAIPIFTDAIDSFKDILETTITDANSMYNYTAQLLADINTAETTNCYSLLNTNFTDMKTELTDYQSTMTDFIDTVDSIPDQLDTYKDYILTYGFEYKNLATFVIWGLAVISVGVFVVMHVFQAHAGMKFGITFGSFSYLLFAMLGFFLMLFVELFGDFCANPIQNLGRAIPSAQDYLVYYATCAGETGQLLNFTSAEAQLRSVNSTINALLNSTDSCSDDDINTVLSSMHTSITALSSILNSAETTVKCSTIRSIFLGVVDDGICSKAYKGLFVAWGSQTIACMALFVTMLVACFSYHYYASYQSDYAVLAVNTDEEHGHEDRHSVDDGSHYGEDSKEAHVEEHYDDVEQGGGHGKKKKKGGKKKNRRSKEHHEFLATEDDGEGVEMHSTDVVRAPRDALV